MSYTKTNWNSGDVITAEKLNKIEDGIEDASSGSGSGGGGSEGGSGFREIVIDSVTGVSGVTWDELTAEFLEPTADIFGLFTVKQIRHNTFNNEEVTYANQVGTVWKLTSCVLNNPNDLSYGVYRVCAMSLDYEYEYSADGEGIAAYIVAKEIDFEVHDGHLYAYIA